MDIESFPHAMKTSLLVQGYETHSKSINEKH